MCTILNTHIIPKLVDYSWKDQNDNPACHIVEIVLGDRKTNVVQENILFAGSKQRVAVLFVKGYVLKNKTRKNKTMKKTTSASSMLTKNIDTLVYSGTYNGYGAIATAYAAYRLGLKCKVFLDSKGIGELKSSLRKDIIKSTQVKKLAALNAEIILCNNYRNARNALYETTQNADWSMKSGYYIMPMGLNDTAGVMVKLLSKQIKKAWVCDKKHSVHDKMRFWLVAGSGGILMSLVAAFPNSHFFVYQTGGGKYLDRLNKETAKYDNITVVNDYKLRHTYNDYAKYYESIKGYDSVIFPYVKEYGEDGDYIWNVASI